MEGFTSAQIGALTTDQVVALNTLQVSKLSTDQVVALMTSQLVAMEAGDLSLEESLKAFEQGIKLTRECQQALDAAEQKVQLLLANTDVPTAVPFDDDADDEPDTGKDD